MDELVTIARYSTAIEANIARSRLEVEGIQAHVASEFSMLRGLDSPASIELQVARAEAERAADILGQRRPRRSIQAWGVEETAERCLVCQSSFVEAEPPVLPLRVLRALLSIALPIPESAFASRRRVCGVCGHRWREGDTATTRAPETWR